MNLPPIASSLTALDVYEPDSNIVYSIEAAARLAQVPRRLIAICCRYGLVSPVVAPECGGWYFNTEAIRTLRRIEYLRTECELNMPAIKLVLDLMREVERLRDEVRFLGSR